VLYAITAALVARLAMGAPDVQQADQRGAIAALAQQPLAGWMLGLLAAGLFAFAIWRFYEVVTEDDELWKRAVHGASGVTYAVLGFLAVTVLLPGRDEGGGDGTTSLTARVMNLPAGRLLVGMAGVAVIGMGGYFIVNGLRRRFMKNLALDEHNAPWAAAVGVVGWVGRGVVSVLVGGFVILAAARHDPQEAKGLDGTLKTLLGESYGRPLLIAVAVGFAAYAALCAVEAKYRRYDG
jgi:hypothetical protein